MKYNSHFFGKPHDYVIILSAIVKAFLAAVKI